MRISDWSADVCSSDLAPIFTGGLSRDSNGGMQEQATLSGTAGVDDRFSYGATATHDSSNADTKIGRASCRERGCQYVEISVVAVTLKKKNTENTNPLLQEQPPNMKRKPDDKTH